jgi:hypothetical protein
MNSNLSSFFIRAISLSSLMRWFLLSAIYFWEQIVHYARILTSIFLDLSFSDTRISYNGPTLDLSFSDTRISYNGPTRRDFKCFKSSDAQLPREIENTGLLLCRRDPAEISEIGLSLHPGYKRWTGTDWLKSLSQYRFISRQWIETFWILLKRY